MFAIVHYFAFLGNDDLALSIITKKSKGCKAAWIFYETQRRPYLTAILISATVHLSIYAILEYNQGYHITGIIMLWLFRWSINIRCYCRTNNSFIYIYIIFIWSKHENMSPCTGSRINTSCKRIASYVKCQFRTQASESQENSPTPAIKPGVLTIYIFSKCAQIYVDLITIRPESVGSISSWRRPKQSQKWEHM